MIKDRFKSRKIPRIPIVARARMKRAVTAVDLYRLATTMSNGKITPQVGNTKATDLKHAVSEAYT